MGDEEKKNDQQLTAEAEKVVCEVVEDLPPEKRKKILWAFRTIQINSGPLPDAETLEHYNRIIPNGGERCMALVEKQAAHRQAQESLVTQTHATKTLRGQWIAGVLCLAFGAGALKLGMAGHDGLAGVVFTTTIGAIITVFVLGKFPPRSVRPKLPTQSDD